MVHARALTPETARAFEAYAGAVIDRYHIPGLAVAVSRDGTPMYARGFGYADVKRDVPATPGTVFGVASVTKSFTAAAIMRLADAGALRVTDPVVHYLPEFRIPKGDAARVKIHHLLTHTAGLPGLASRWYAFARSAARDPEGVKPPVRVDAGPPIETYADLLAYMAEDDWTPLGPPGAQWLRDPRGGTRTCGIPPAASARQSKISSATSRSTGPVGWWGTSASYPARR